jgi:hypothetical protein
MAIELARTHALPRPWGVVDLKPCNKTDNTGFSVGEFWCERPGKPTSNPSLLLKLLFASQPLSIRFLTIFTRSQAADIRTRKKGLVVLAAHAGAGPVPRLQQRIGHPGAMDVKLPREVQVTQPLARTKTAVANEPMGTMQ